MKKWGVERNRSWVRGVVAVALLGVCVSSEAFGRERRARVLIDSWAREQYEAAKLENGKPRLETYHLLKGKYFGGYLRDDSLGKVEFEEMVDVLGEEMRKRNYHPSIEPMEGDLLIVVHWGVTGIQEGFTSLFPGTSPVFGEGVLDKDGFTYRRGKNADLIGFRRILRQKGMTSQDVFELRELLDEERYFMILMAFDLPKLLGSNEKRLLWSTRFSLRATSTNFEEAHFALSRGASDYFGTNLEGKLGRSRVLLGPGGITRSEIEVVKIFEGESVEE